MADEKNGEKQPNPEEPKKRLKVIFKKCESASCSTEEPHGDFVFSMDGVDGVRMFTSSLGFGDRFIDGFLVQRGYIDAEEAELLRKEMREAGLKEGYDPLDPIRAMTGLRLGILARVFVAENALDRDAELGNVIRNPFGFYGW